MRKALLFFCLASLLWCSGCANVPSPLQRLQRADQLASSYGWCRQQIEAPPFVLTAYLPNSAPTYAGSILTVYIEGDGLAWVSPSRASADPSPVEPIGLKMALQHPDGAVAYLARPCQYNTEQVGNCSRRFWTDARFSSEVISASDTAITSLKRATNATSLRLVGYSGGGAVAALVSARRSDVIQLITVAGNLDHRAWASSHRLSPLEESLNPADEWPTLQNLPQVHLVGGRDDVVGQTGMDAYRYHFPDKASIHTRLFPDYTHQCCWVDAWPEIYQQALVLLESARLPASP